VSSVILKTVSPTTTAIGATAVRSSSSPHEISQSHHNSHTTHNTRSNSPQSHLNIMPGSSVYTGAPPTLSKLEQGMRVSLKHIYAETRRQKESVGVTKASQATRETRETTEDGKLRPWRKGFEKHLRQYTATAVDEYTRGHLSDAFDQFGANLRAQYSEVDQSGQTYLFAESRGQTRIARELLGRIINTPTVESSSPIHKSDDLGLIVLTPRHKPSHQFAQYHYLAPHQPPLNSHPPSPPKYHCSSDQN